MEGNWNRPPTNFGLKVALTTRAATVSWKHQLVIRLADLRRWRLETSSINLPPPISSYLLVVSGGARNLRLRAEGGRDEKWGTDVPVPQRCRDIHSHLYCRREYTSTQIKSNFIIKQKNHDGH